MNDTDRPVETMIDDIRGAADGRTVTLGELLDRFEDRSLGAVLVIFGVITALPVIGAIPGVPALAAALILLSVLHALIGGNRHFWAPRRLRRRTFSTTTVEKVLGRVRPYGRRLDRMVVNRRLSFLVETQAARVFILIGAAILAVLMVFLAPVPFAVLPVSFACICLGLALVGRDGLFALAGYVLLGVCIAVLAALWGTIFGA